jgi:ABC-type lipoprotein export system ATPase subunit
VAIARALANSPDVLLADEPTGNLDSSTSQEIIDLLRRLSRTEGLSIVLVTHDGEVAAAADRVVRMSDGRVIEDTRVTV